MLRLRLAPARDRAAAPARRAAAARAGRPRPAAGAARARRGLRADRRPARALAGHEDLRALRARTTPRTRATRARSAPGSSSPSRPIRRAWRALLARGLEVPAAEDADFVGASPALAKLKSQIAQFAAAPYPVLIEGESGSGKELVGARLHRLSPRAGAALLQPQLRRDLAARWSSRRCSATSRARSPARSRPRPGYFEDARDGTLFLDEIGELPLEHAGEAAARAGERRVPARRRDAAPHRALPRDRRHQPRPAPRGARGRVPRRPLPPPVGVHARRAAAARAGAGQAAAARALPPAARAQKPVRARRGRRARAGCATTFPATCASCATS